VKFKKRRTTGVNRQALAVEAREVLGSKKIFRYLARGKNKFPKIKFVAK